MTDAPRGADAPLADVVAPRPVLSTVLDFHGKVWDVVTDEVDLGLGGVVHRDYIKHTGAVAIMALNEVTPLGRPGSSDDIAKAALFLCGPDGDYITGQTLCVDGGASLLMLPTPQMFADVARRWQERREG